MTFFSVVIPVYNRVHLIDAAIQSVLNQSFCDYEILVIDDGSTDGTYERLSEYGDSIRIFRQKNSGPGATRNVGISHARGKYVTFLDSDDLWFPWTLVVYYKVIQQHKMPVFVAGTEVNFHSVTELSSIQEEPYYVKFYRDYYAATNEAVSIVGCGAAIRHDILHSVGGFANLWINAEDSDLWLKLGTAPGFVHIQSPPVLGYRRHPESAIANIDKTYQGIQYLVQQEKNSNYPGGEAHKQQRIEILTRHLRPASLACIKQGEFKKGFELYSHSFLWHLSQRRLRYLFGFPLISTLRLLQRQARIL